MAASTSTTTTYGGSTNLICTSGVFDLTSQATLLTYANTGTDAMVCQIAAWLGDGSDDLDGTGGDFELTMEFGAHTVQPDPQLIRFDTSTRATVFTEQFPLPIGETVTVKIRSPNAADTTVYAHTCIYEVGVESIRDELAAILLHIGTTTNTSEDPPSTPGGGTGVYPNTTGSGTGVYPGRC